MRETDKQSLKPYYMGLDIGTDSVGYAVTDERYHLIKFKGEPMWGSHLFDAAKQCDERRSFRTARRRLDRRQQRVALVDEIFAPEVCKVDPNFYIRKKESALYAEDKTNPNDKYVYFNDPTYSDKEYYSKYPTIHHLIYALMTEDREFDIRLINIAVDWLVAHRGHFLLDVSSSNTERVMDFSVIYDQFMDCFDPDDESHSYPWDKVSPNDLANVLKIRGVNNKKQALKDLLYGGKIPTDDYYIDRKELISFMSGGKVSCNKLFTESEFDEDMRISISDDMETLLPQLGDYADIIAGLAAMYDWSVLSDILSGYQTISESKIHVYEKHKEDLKKLKRYVRTYAKDKYDEIFRYAKDGLNNYSAYTNNFDSRDQDAKLPEKKISEEEFYSFLKKTLDLEKVYDKSEIAEEDKRLVLEILKSMETHDYMPKQVVKSNRVIPQQLYYSELVRILDNASKHYPFLTDRNSDGYSPKDKILSVFSFRIPYYVGPLRKDNSAFAWIERKADGRIYPWNFESMVDLDASENAFISRMTNSCSYIPGETVLPKNSLIYSKFMVLNEINNIKVNNVPISVDVKKRIYTDLFTKHVKVTPKRISEYLILNGYIQIGDELSGIDVTIKSSLKSGYDFRRLLQDGRLTEKDVERIIERCTYTEDKARYRKWISDNYKSLDGDDIKYISRLKYKDFGRLSYFFLNTLIGMDKSTGETGSVIHFLWETNDNLMQILSDRYTFTDEIGKLREDYYAEHKITITDQMDIIGLSNAVKRPVTRTLAVVKDIVSTKGYAPQKIFVEMARGGDIEKKRTLSRKDQILKLYETVEEDTRQLRAELESMGDEANNKLQSDKLFLYYLQLGKDMYRGEPISLTELMTKSYDIDHIYPQSLVKDDSLLNNRVLSRSEDNGNKQDIYPIDSDIRHRMTPFWKMLLDKGLITREKYSRLVRSTPFTETEKMGFINRQLVETRQSMKAVTRILHFLYPDSEIVYVKANLAADFRKEFNLTRKVRSINDLHHAKDAYLNIVVGNVYNEKFTKPIACGYFNPEEKYSVKTTVLFGKLDVKKGDAVIWDHNYDLNTVKTTYEHNNIHLTRYSYCTKGGLFDQNPLKKGLGQVPLKKDMNISKYGGYNKPSASFFILVNYLRGGKKEVSFVPVELAVSEHFLTDEGFALDYAKKTLESLNTKKIDNVKFPLDLRPIKIKTLLSLDGYKVWINGKANGGRILLLSNAESLVFDRNTVEYIRSLEKYSEKRRINKNIHHDEAFDNLSEIKNVELYEALLSKIGNSLFAKMPGNQGKVLTEGKESFRNLMFEEQIRVLINCISLFKSGRTGGVDLTKVNGKSQSGAMTLGANLSTCKYEDVRILDISPAGLHVNLSENLMDYLQ